jgi:hypothetical protein
VLFFDSNKNFYVHPNKEIGNGDQFLSILDLEFSVQLISKLKFLNSDELMAPSGPALDAACLLQVTGPSVTRNTNDFSKFERRRPNRPISPYSRVPNSRTPPPDSKSPIHFSSSKQPKEQPKQQGKSEVRKMAEANSYEEQRRMQVEENKRKLEELRLHRLSAAVRAAAVKPMPVGPIFPSSPKIMPSLLRRLVFFTPSGLPGCVGQAAEAAESAGERRTNPEVWPHRKPPRAA